MGSVKGTGRSLLAMASHEAAQAVIGRKLGLVCGGVSINGTHAKAAIRALPPDLHKGSMASQSLLQRYCIATLAGPRAEQILTGHSNSRMEENCVRAVLLNVTGFGPDARADNNWRFQRAKLNHLTIEKVLAHLSEIELVSRRLIDRGSLSGREISSMLMDENYSGTDHTPFSLKDVPLTGLVGRFPL